MSSPLIVTRLLGGLGNQMFQYALGRHLAQLNGGILKLDTTEFENYKFHKYGLNHFNISAEVATRSEIRRFYALKRNRVFRFIGSAGIPGLGKSAFVREASLRYDGRILEMRGNLYLDGYWQSEMYFRDFRDQLRAELTVNSSPDAENRKMAEAIADGPSASIHVRLGSYLSDIGRKIHGLLPGAYYERAVARILDVEPEVRFFLFSDEPPEALKRIPLPASRVETVAINDATNRNFEDLRLMTLTDHHIIANSSFSWWGAWLSRDHGITIAPKQWFADKSLDSSTIVPTRWTVL